jgi:hypothetical protein
MLSPKALRFAPSGTTRSSGLTVVVVLDVVLDVVEDDVVEDVVDDVDVEDDVVVDDVDVEDVDVVVVVAIMHPHPTMKLHSQSTM